MHRYRTGPASAPAALSRSTLLLPLLALALGAAGALAGCEEEKKEEPPGSPLAVSTAAQTYVFGTEALCHPESVTSDRWRTCDGQDSIRIAPGMSDAKVYPTMTVEVPPFALEVTEVTNAQYLRCVDEGACTEPMDEDIPGLINDYWLLPEYANHPVVNVTWAQADTYCRWAGRRLPTEYEWELVAGGPLDTEGRGGRFVVPEGAETASACAGQAVNVAFCGGEGRPVAVGTAADDVKTVGGVAVHDLGGNVAEWVADRWVADITCAETLESCQDCFLCRDADTACERTCNQCPACEEAGDACFVQCPDDGPADRGFPVCIRHTDTVVDPQGPGASDSDAHAVRGGDYDLDETETCRLRVSGRSRHVRDLVSEPWAPDIGFRCAAEPPPVEEE